MNRKKELREEIWEEIERAKHIPCVRSGMCCTHAACLYGEWDAKKHQCTYLEIEVEIDGVAIHRCGKYEEIKNKPGAGIHPAFGSGCSSSLFNDNRNAIIRLILARHAEGCSSVDSLIDSATSDKRCTTSGTTSDGDNTGRSDEDGT